MAMIEYELDENVAVVTMNSGENRFNFDFLQAFLDVLDEIEHTTEANVLVVSSAHEKIWSNGIDLDWLLPAVAENPETAKEFPMRLMQLLKRILIYPMITVAAITGHAFAGAAVLACAFDFRFMRSDRGYFCLPEVDLRIPFLPGMDALLKKALPLYKFTEAQFSGKRYTAQECEEHHIVVKACHIDELMGEVVAFAKTFDKDRNVLGKMKQVTFKEILKVMEEDDPAYLEAQIAARK